MEKINLSNYKNTLGFKHKLKRLLFQTLWMITVRPLPRSLGNVWKISVLRFFGAQIHKTATIYSSVRIYAPWNLVMHEYSCLAPEVDCYNVDLVTLGSHTTVSQKAYLCTASHDITSTLNPLITAPIKIEDQAWIGADAYVGMGVIIAQGAVVGARACVYKNIEPWTIVGGNPSKFIKNREINE